jgi:Leucine-rich repeat (LRR) protein
MSSLPESFEQFQNIKILFFAGNDFEIVPTVLGKLPSLYMLSFKGNKLKHIPEESITPSITWLILTDNQLSDLPTSIGQLSGLRKLMLTGNNFERVPAAIQNCHALQLLRISLNRLQHLPQWLLRLPDLSWLAFSGNPCCLENSSNSQNKLPIVNISQLTVGEKLGEGASSLVFKVKRDDGITYLKLFLPIY